MFSTTLSKEEFEATPIAALYKIYCLAIQERDSALSRDNESRSLLRSLDALLQKESQRNLELNGLLEKASHNKAVVPKSKPALKYPAKSIDEGTNIVLLGSSMFGRLQSYNFPADVQIFTYRGTTTDQKIDIIRETPDKKLRELIIYTGTCDILNTTLSANEILEKIKTLVDLSITKFNQDKTIIVEVIPILTLKSAKPATYIYDPNSKQNERIKELNNEINSYGTETDNLDILKMHDQIAESDDPTLFYFDDLHLNDNKGVPKLQMELITVVLGFSDRNPKDHPRTRAAPSGQNTNHYNHAQTSGHTGPGFNSNYNSNYNYSHFPASHPGPRFNYPISGHTGPGSNQYHAYSGHTGPGPLKHGINHFNARVGSSPYYNNRS